MARPPKCKSAFTLVELLVVIGIIAVLVALLLPALNKARSQAQVVACGSNMRQIGIAIAMYQVSYKGCLPIYNDWWVFSGFVPTSASVGNTSLSGLGLLYEGKFMATSKVAYCPAEVAWSENAVASNPAGFIFSAFQDQHKGEWRDIPGSRWNSSYMYRWGCPNPHGFLSPWFPNLQSIEGQIFAMKSATRRGFTEKGLLTENMMDHGFSPANAQGSAHRGGGNALYYDGSVKFLTNMKNIYNPGNGPYGYYLGTLIFMDQIDGR